MIKLLQFLFLILLTVGTVTTQSSCDPCSPTSEGAFLDRALGTWRLVRVESPTRTQTQFSEPQTLKIALEADSRGNSVTRETLLRDTTTIDRLEWDVLGGDCRNKNVLVTYENRQQRKYWIGSNSQTLRATGYVDEVGGKADTLMYYYESVP